MNKSDKKRLDIAFNEAVQIIKSAKDDDISSLLGDGIFQSLLEAIATPKTKKDQTIYEYLLEHKHRLQLLSLVRLAIQNNYAIKGKVGEINVFVSPWYIQWHEDGVMFLQGEKQFEGLIGLYQNGKVKFGIATRMILGGEKIGPDDLEFVAVDEMEKRSKQPSVPKSVSELENALVELETLLKKGDNDESSYQNYFINNPWVFGAKYKLIESHKPFNDENIPDFTGVRVRDSARDIIEIKPPFLPLFTQRNQFRSDFNTAWNQAERYLDFARQESDYLKRQKKLFFENPKCYLLVGYNLSKTQMTEIRRKERMNHAITILTYNDLFVMAQSTVNFFKSLTSGLQKAHPLKTTLVPKRKITRKRIVLISCVSQKLPHRTKARDLYTSTLFKFNLKYAEKLAPDEIFVLSAKHGLLALEQEIEPYEQTLNNMRSSEIQVWANHVLDQIKGVCSIDDAEFIFLAGDKYRKHLLPHIKNYKVPLKGLRIGEQLQKLKGLMS